MNAMVQSSEASGCCKQINGATVFYYFPHDIETALIKVMNEIYELAEIVQRSISNAFNNNNTTLNDTVNDHTPT